MPPPNQDVETVKITRGDRASASASQGRWKQEWSVSNTRQTRTHSSSPIPQAPRLDLDQAELQKDSVIAVMKQRIGITIMIISGLLAAVQALIWLSAAAFDLQPLWAWLLIALAGTVLTVLIPLLIFRQRMASSLLATFHLLPDRLASASSSNDGVTIADLPYELQCIAHACNTTFSRYRQQYERLRQFSDSVIHEFEPSLAQLCEHSAQITSKEDDVLLTHLKDMHQAVQRLRSLNAYLLQPLTPDPHPCALDALVQTSWRSAASIAKDRDLTVEWHLDGGDRALAYGMIHIEKILRDCFHNAVTHCDEGGIISITSAYRNRYWILEIANTGARLSGQDIDRVFEPFWRGASASRADQLHTGLGLSIVQSLADHLGCRTEAELNEQRWFTLRLSIPRSLLTMSGGGDTTQSELDEPG